MVLEKNLIKRIFSVQISRVKTCLGVIMRIGENICGGWALKTSEPALFDEFSRAGSDMKLE